MDLMTIFKWADDSAIGEFIRSRTWPFPLVETVHILALAVFMGALFLVDLRLMGLKFGGITAQRITREMNRYIDWGIALILATGVMLFASEGGKLYENAAFMPKMYFLGAALVSHYTLHRRAVQSENPPAWGALAGVLSQFLWLATGAAGRAIGFV